MLIEGCSDELRCSRWCRYGRVGQTRRVTFTLCYTCVTSTWRHSVLVEVSVTVARVADDRSVYSQCRRDHTSHAPISKQLHTRTPKLSTKTSMCAEYSVPSVIRYLSKYKKVIKWVYMHRYMDMYSIVSTFYWSLYCKTLFSFLSLRSRKLLQAI